MSLDLVLADNLDRALEICLPMESYSYLTEATFTDNSTDFITKFYVQNLFKSLEVFEIEDVEELHIRIHVPVKSFQLAYEIHFTVPRK